MPSNRASQIVVGLPLALVTLAVSVFAESDESPATGEVRRIERDTICGPRCAAYVLKCYGLNRKDELYKAVRATQWPEILEGSTMESLRRYLAERGAFAVGVDIPRGHVLRWNYPVIVHLTPADAGPGHYVVWLPESTDETAVLWTGRAHHEVIDTWSLAERMSPSVLLTSPTSISQITTASGLPPDAMLFRIGLLTAFLLAGWITILFSGQCRIAAAS